MTVEASKPKGPEKDLTWQQTKLIEGYKIMGNTLAVLLPEQPRLAAELDALLHETNLSYEGVIRCLFFECGWSVPELAAGPIIKAYLATPQGIAKEKSNPLQDVLNLASISGYPKDTINQKFQEWTEDRVGFMAKGLQNLVLSNQVIEPLTNEEIIRKKIAANLEWKKEHPKEVADIQTKATRAARQAARPRKYPVRIRQRIQGLLDQNYSYREAASILAAEGFETTIAGLKYVTSRYSLHYTPEEARKQARRGLAQATVKIFEGNPSRARTREILIDMGISPRTADALITKLGLRERIDWNVPIAEGQTLTDLMRDFTTRGYLEIKIEYKTFVKAIQAMGLKLDISYQSYASKRKLVVDL